MYKGMPRQITAAISRSTAYDFNAQLAYSHMCNIDGVGSSIVSHTLLPEVRDVMPGEILFAFKQTVSKAEGRLRAMSSLNSVKLGPAICNDVQETLIQLGAPIHVARLFDDNVKVAMRSELIKWLYDNPDKRDAASIKLSEHFQYMGIAVTGCLGGPQPAIQRQGFTATRGGFVTIVNTGRKAIEAGEKLCMIIDVLDVVQNDRGEDHRLDGVPRQKILARLQAAPIENTSLEDIMHTIDYSNFNVTAHEPFVLSPNMQLVAESIASSKHEQQTNEGTASSGQTNGSNQAGGSSQNGSSSQAGSSSQTTSTKFVNTAFSKRYEPLSLPLNEPTAKAIDNFKKNGIIKGNNYDARLVKKAREACAEYEQLDEGPDFFYDKDNVLYVKAKQTKILQWSYWQSNFQNTGIVPLSLFTYYSLETQETFFRAGPTIFIKMNLIDKLENLPFKVYQSSNENLVSVVDCLQEVLKNKQDAQIWNKKFSINQITYNIFNDTLFDDDKFEEIRNLMKFQPQFELLSFKSHKEDISLTNEIETNIPVWTIKLYNTSNNKYKTKRETTIELVPDAQIKFDFTTIKPWLVLSSQIIKHGVIVQNPMKPDVLDLQNNTKQVILSFTTTATEQFNESLQVNKYTNVYNELNGEIIPQVTFTIPDKYKENSVDTLSKLSTFNYVEQNHLLSTNTRYIYQQDETEVIIKPFLITSLGGQSRDSKIKYKLKKDKISINFMCKFGAEFGIDKPLNDLLAVDVLQQPPKQDEIPCRFTCINLNIQFKLNDIVQTTNTIANLFATTLQNKRWTHQVLVINNEQVPCLTDSSKNYAWVDGVMHITDITGTSAKTYNALCLYNMKETSDLKGDFNQLFDTTESTLPVAIVPGHSLIGLVDSFYHEDQPSKRQMTVYSSNYKDIVNVQIVRTNNSSNASSTGSGTGGTW